MMVRSSGKGAFIAIGFAVAAVAAVAGCGGGKAASVDAPPGDAAPPGSIDAEDAAACPADGAELIAEIYQFAMAHRACQQASDCVAVGVFRETCDCALSLPLAVNRAAQASAQMLIAEAVACGDVPMACDDFYTSDVSCTSGQCRLGRFGMCLPPPPADAAPADARQGDAAPADARQGDAAAAAAPDATRPTDAAP